MMVASCRHRLYVCFAWLGICVILISGCSILAGCNFESTTVEETSRTYPNSQSNCRCPTTFKATNRFERVLIIVLENRDYQEAITDDYLHQLAREGACFSNFHGRFHPSYSNYLAMVAGKDIVTHFDRQVDLKDVCSIADLLVSKGLDWKNYAQGYPEPDELNPYPNRCYTNDRRGRYARKHVPFMSFSSIQDDEEKCSHIVAADQFDLDRKNLPAYSFYSPDLDNDGHDTSLKFASTWLKGFLDPLLNDEAFMKKTLIVVTFDESRDESPGSDNHIYTVFLGGMVKPNKEAKSNYNHYNVLRTIEENFGLCALGEGDGGAKPIVGVWK
jgi:Phosphoesterase family